MSMVARTEPRPAEDDITDTDDGDTRISAGAFWPDIVLRELRLAVRLPGRVTLPPAAYCHRGCGTRYPRAGSMAAGTAGSWPSDAGRCSGTRN
ncbi:Head completion/stabilization protein L [Escherichia coli]|nr:Head completion/stabilization protein L [Escherichia coli]